jgi:electron transfer flavoprotein alpha subunit
MSEIWVILELNGTALQAYSSELLGEIASLARRQHVTMTLCALLLTAPGSELPTNELLSSFGVQHLYILEHPLLDHYSTQSYIQALTWLMQRSPPLLIVASATANGRDWTPRFAAQQHLPFVPSCLSFDLRDDAIYAFRALYDGRAYVQTQTLTHNRTALVTLVPGLRGAPTRPVQPTAQSHPLAVAHLTPPISVEVSATGGQIRHIAIQAPSPEEVELSIAERIVAGGRGVGQEGFTTLASFAHKLGAVVGATRVATDLGWIEHERQIGATGKIVRPRLYIAAGISGAAQHISGMSESQTIIAINPDRSAPIFALADLGLLGDANEILPLASKLLDE